MLIQYLNGAIKDLEGLISCTKLDIEDIKRANHDEIFSRNAQRDFLIREFEMKKSLVDQEIRALQNQSPDVELKDLLSEDVINRFGDMRATLSELKKVNSDYARIVFAVSEFFTSLMNKIIPQESIVYGENKKASTTSQATFLQIEV